MKNASTITPAAAAGSSWDVVVIGAGPAGTFSARQLALAGKRVLLLEKSSFPREKVCGGCVSWKATRLLQQQGLEPWSEQLKHGTADRLRLIAGGQSTCIPMAPVSIVSRATFDEYLVNAAVTAGAAFLCQTSAVIGERQAASRTIECREPQHGSFEIASKLVVAADGLSHSSLSRLHNLPDKVADVSHIGIGAIIHEDEAWLNEAGLAPGIVQMAVGRQGYVGLARSTAGQLHVAAAVAPALLAQESALNAVVANILTESGQLTWAERSRVTWCAANWSGTPRLSHRMHCVAADGVFVVGDSAGYVEPFTGEGIYWALQSAANLSSLLATAGTWSNGQAELEWQERHRKFLRTKTKTARLVTTLLRMPRLTRWSIRALNAMPRAAVLLAWLMNGCPSADQVSI
ncbi:NAD(P)/FAD-dependent oxidoreductase [Anatilimnocola floriformis]|uniref:NAD(P)/FAD-dependent oxidoreductase n=1 Tax=Anatilimnocola floriformis TaxID=2948575 RepID=UPI0020C31BC1|nr:NAD(P)/FAD-dependent oxidoreductase [Anatilimnocola floriformis]